MNSLSFPDLNVWLALIAEDHSRRSAAMAWWREEEGSIGFCRFTQIGLLRLLTTPVVMNGKPLTMRAAWAIYDRLFDDERTVLLPEPTDIEPDFRKRSSTFHASPKVWANAYLLAFARPSGAALITFDKACASGDAQRTLLQ